MHRIQEDTFPEMQKDNFLQIIKHQKRNEWQIAFPGIAEHHTTQKCFVARHLTGLESRFYIK